MTMGAEVQGNFSFFFLSFPLLVDLIGGSFLPDGPTLANHEKVAIRLQLLCEFYYTLGKTQAFQFLAV